MSKLRDALREKGVVNTHDLLMKFARLEDDIAVSYHQRSAGRMGIGDYSRTNVWAVGRHIGDDPVRLFRSRREKIFPGRRADSMQAALEWAAKTYGITTWETCPLSGVGTKVPASIVDRARAFLKGVKP